MALILTGGDYLLLADAAKILLTGDVGAVYHTVAPAWRTADFGNGTTSVQWPSPLDPAEMKNYTINCATEMNGIGSRILSATVELSLLASGAGLRIFGLTYDATNVTVWLYINELDRDRLSWRPPGEVHTMLCSVRTLDAHVFERLVRLPIRQVGP